MQWLKSQIFFLLDQKFCLLKPQRAKFDHKKEENISNLLFVLVQSTSSREKLFRLPRLSPTCTGQVAWLMSQYFIFKKYLNRSASLGDTRWTTMSKWWSETRSSVWDLGLSSTNKRDATIYTYSSHCFKCQNNWSISVGISVCKRCMSLNSLDFAPFCNESGFPWMHVLQSTLKIRFKIYSLSRDCICCLFIWSFHEPSRCWSSDISWVITSQMRPLKRQACQAGDGIVSLLYSTVHLPPLSFIAP